MNIKIDISLCRVCLQQGPGTNIYTGNILEKFQFTTLVQVEKNDGLSEIICKKCLTRLHIAYKFKKDAIASNRDLRSFISNVNKQFQEVTGSTIVKTEKRGRKQSAPPESIASSDELDEDMQALIDDEQDAVEYKGLDDDSSDEHKKTIDREQLVEILGENNAISVRKIRMRRTGMASIQEDTADEQPENMEVLLMEENSEIESAEHGYIIDEYEPVGGELITDEIDEAQYLEDEENDDSAAYDALSEKANISPQKGSKNSAAANPDNRCDVCQKAFSTRTNLTRHRITHEGRKPYVCSICGNSFTQNGSLKSHMFIHTGERPYQCTECGKAFTQSKSLVFHMRRHTGEKPFPCEFCGIKFRQKDGLKRHINAKHVQNRAHCHICNVCGRVLNSKYSLTSHMARHTAKEMAAAKRKNRSATASASTNSNDDKQLDAIPNSKPGSSDTGDEWDELYSCEYCDQEFTNASDLMEHRETHEDNTKYMDDSN